jgi:hypothetical protein
VPRPAILGSTPGLNIPALQSTEYFLKSAIKRLTCGLPFFSGFHRLSLGYRAGYSLDTGAKPEIGDKIHTEQDTICIKVQ